MAKTKNKEDYKLYYADEHTNCFLYDNHEDAVITQVSKKKGTVYEFEEKQNRVFFLLKGKINFMFGRTYTVFQEGTFILFPRGCKFKMNIEKDASMLLITMHYKINFCEHFPLEMLNKLNEQYQIKNTKMYPLKINQMLYLFLDNISAAMSSGLKCSYLHELKQREMLYYFRAYYCKRDLVSFFSPILNDDSHFAEVIYQNYETIKNISELAKITNYSISGFKKQFVKVFGVAPHQWIDREKAKKIHYEINCTQKTFKEILSDFNFYSASHFNAFCKRMFGMSPSNLRKTTICAVSMDKFPIDNEL